MPFMFLSLVLITLILMLGFVFYAVLSFQLNEFERDVYSIKFRYESRMKKITKELNVILAN